MSHDLDPIRALYGEASSEAPGAPALDAAGRAEVEQLAPVRSALENLPAVSPPADAVAAVLAMARREAAASQNAAPPADLDAIRALYGEGAAELGAEAQAEFTALAPARDALDQLAPVAPPADTVAAVLAMARREAAASQNATPAEDLAVIRALYGEGAAELSAEAQAEAAALAPVRSALENLPAVSPPADAVAAVLAMARREAGGEADAAPVSPALRRPAADRAAARPPANPSRRRFRIGLPVLGVLVAGIALVVALGPGSGTVSEDVVATTEESVLAPEVDAADAAASAFSAEDEPTLVAASPAPAPSPAATVARAELAEDPAAWEVTDDLPALALRVQALQAAGELEWEEPPVALGSRTSLEGNAAPAAGWMQVRMEGPDR